MEETILNRKDLKLMTELQKKNGFDHYRVITSACQKESGQERVFYFEFYIINNTLSPEECVLGYKSRFEKTAEDLQYALTGTLAQQNVSKEIFVTPSYLMVKAGVFGKNGKSVNRFVPMCKVELGKKNFSIVTSKGEACECGLTSDSCYGIVDVNRIELANHPEYLCQSGKIVWNLKFENFADIQPTAASKTSEWTLINGNLALNGKIELDDEEYIVKSSNCYGYFERSCGKEMEAPYFHLNSNNFISQITGQSLKNSYFAVQGEFNHNISVVMNLEGNEYQFMNNDSSVEIHYNCTQMPTDEEEVYKVHWAVSVSSKKYIVDIDFFGKSDEMYLRDYESPLGKRKLMKILCGNGSGTLRFYKKLKSNLETMEDVEISSCVCEF